MNSHTHPTPSIERGLLFAEIARHAQSGPGLQAMVEPGRFDLSFGRLWPMLEDLRTLVERAGIGPDDVVAVVLPDALCCLVSLLGVASVCVCAPINPGLAEPELERDLTDLRAVAVLGMSGSGTLAVAARLGLLIVESSIDEAGCSWHVHPHVRAPRRDVESLPSGTVILLHTSATTGRRKIVPLTATNLHAMLGNTSRALQLQSDDRLLLMAKLFHIQGLLSSWAQLRSGGTVIAAPEYSAQGFQHWLADQSPSWFTGGPTLLRSIVRNLESFPIAKPTSLRFVRSGGAILPPELRLMLQEKIGVPVLDVYGLTEVGGIASTTLSPGRSSGCVDDARGVGRSIGPEIAVMGEDGSLLGPYEEGQVVTRGLNVMGGYLNDPEANRQAYRDGWFLTGDLGHLDAEGFLYITGRMKEMINRGGQKIIPDEVDAVIATHEAVREVASFSVVHPSLGEDVACAIVLREGCEVSDEEIREFAAARLSSYKVPRTIYRLEALPRGATGKPQRLVLRDRFAEAKPLGQTVFGVRSITPASPLRVAGPSIAQEVTAKAPTDLADALSELWKKCLNLEHITVEDDFFAIGGDSLSAAAMLSEVEAIFSLPAKLSDSRFFRTPTLAMLHKLCAEAMAGTAGARASNAIELVAVLPRASKVSFYMIPSDGAEGFCFRQLGRQMNEDWSLHLVRPSSLWHERSITSIEDAAGHSADLIQAADCADLCVVGGFCYGGVIAYETARLLEDRGKPCLLLLFDVPVPGFPRITRDALPVFRIFCKTLGLSLMARKPRPAMSMARRLLRRAAWTVLRNARPESRIWHRQPLRWACEQAQAGYFSFVWPSKTQVPLLHFMATDAQDSLLEISRHAWEIFAENGITTIVLPGQHDTIFSASNVPSIICHIERWLTETSATRLAGLSSRVA